MRILAVIPACEGSESLPNKNIRLIKGKPMIYYVINNARKSKYVTDIIVTTNSEAIVSMSKQMGVMTRLRDDDLSNNEVSLDMVVYDVFNQVDLNNYDCIVTLQSISPALRVTTLDSAIEFFLKESFDTVISVKREQRYYWEKKQNNAIPLYEKRVNRHNLPPVYVETGAFLITKPQFVKKNDRVGENVFLYELREDESIDVFSFGDLKQVENIIEKKHIAFYVNGNNEMGLGHISRTLQLADELFEKPDIFFDQNKTIKDSFGKTTHNLIGVNGRDGFINAIEKKEYNVIINDDLSTTLEYMEKLRTASKKSRIINFEDEGSGAKNADVVINALYENKVVDNALVGSKYFIISKNFLLYNPIEIREKVENVLITFGGADPKKYTERLIDIIKDVKYSTTKFHVVLGGAKKNASNIINDNRLKNIVWYHNIDNMPEIINKCDIALTSRGRTCFELAAMGIPTISIAQNLREQQHNFVVEKNGFMYLGYNPENNIIIEKLDTYLELDQSNRKIIQEKMLKNDLRHGRENVLTIINM